MITPRRIANSSHRVRSNADIHSKMTSGPPTRWKLSENTDAPNTMKKTIDVIVLVCTVTEFNDEKDKRFRASATNSAPKTPTPAASVSVAKPRMMLSGMDAITATDASTNKRSDTRLVLGASSGISTVFRKVKAK